MNIKDIPAGGGIMSIVKARHIVPVLIAAVIAAGLLLSTGIWESLELKAYDLRMRLLNRIGTGSFEPTGKIVIVGMEEKTMIKEKPLIFWYPEIGKFIHKMNASGVRAVGIDLIPVHSLGEKMSEAGRTLFTEPRYLKLFEEMGLQADNALLGPMLEAEEMEIIQGVAEGLVPYYHGFMGFMKNVHPASVSLTVDKDQIIRRQKLMEGDAPTFPYAFYTALGGRKLEGGIRINYALKDRIPFYPFSQVMDEKFDARRLAGKGILLGYITGYDDFHSTAIGRIPGAFIHAAFIETMLSGETLNDVSRPVSSLLLVLLVVVSLFISVWLSPLAAMVAIGAVAALFFAFDFHLFSRGTVVPLFPHMLAPLLTYAFIYPYRYIVEERTRKQLYKTFSYYMDKKVIDSLISRDPGSLLRGEQKTLCILFLDIRDFTNMSHQKRPEAVIDFLNRFFTVVTDSIQRHNGFVNKFIGDAVLAFFNSAPDAVNASLDILKSSGSLSENQSVRDFLAGRELKIGIGIHSGDVVMGNIGSVRKMDFTIIGEAVNIASRIEKLTKQLKRPILLSETAATSAGDAFKFEFLGEHKLRGLEKPVGIYTL